MTMLSAQPITLTGEQHDRLWGVAKEIRRAIEAGGARRNALAVLADLYSLGPVAEIIERILIDAQDAAPPATAASGEAA